VLPEGYYLRDSWPGEREILVEFMIQTYQELFPEQKNLSHLGDTVRGYFSSDTPLWWVESSNIPIGCLWMGTAIDQITGLRYAHIFIIYVRPAHRRQGIGTTLLQQAQMWAQARGDHQLGLQVFLHNQGALNLYQRLGFQAQSLLMTKPLNRRVVGHPE
jgi:ribosomal protein S18 acetylase RimI-like enzyme